MTSLRQSLHSLRTMGERLVDNRAGQYQKVVARSPGGTFHWAVFSKEKRWLFSPRNLATDLASGRDAHLL